MPPARLLVTGTLAFDTVARVERLPGPDETVRVADRAERPGGAGANVAVGLARLGAEPTFLTAVGPDFRGSSYEGAITDEDLALVAVVGERSTSRAWLFSDGDGRQQIYYDGGSERAMSDLEVPLPFLGAARGEVVAHFAAGNLAAYPPLMGTLPRVTFDPGQEVFHRPLTEVEACLPHVDVLFVNRHEKRRLEEGLGVDLQGLASTGELEALVVTLGREGARVVTEEGSVDVGSVPAEPRDVSGAGDAHRAGFLLGLAHGMAWEVCARLGSVVAACVIEEMGTQTGAPGLEEARDRYEEAWGPWPLPED